jgi:hypothetical protein
LFIRDSISGRRGLRRGTRKSKKRKEKRIEKRNKKKKYEEVYQTKGMSLFALLKTCLSHFTHYSFTIYRWITDGGCRMQDSEDDNGE